MKPPKPKLIKHHPQGSALRGFLHFVMLPFWLIYVAIKASIQYFLHAPTVIKVIMVTFVSGLFAVGGFAGYKLLQNRKQANINLYRTEFDSAVIESNEEKMIEVLEKISKLRPNETFYTKRIQALKTGMADVDDSEFCLYMARIHARHKRTADSVREAKKRLQNEPKDWLCNCIVAQDLITNGKIEEAKPFLDHVKDVDSVQIKPTIGMILHAIELRQLCNLDNSELRSFILTRILPNIRNANLEQVKPEGKLQIIYTYITATLNAPQTVIETTMPYWSVANRLCDQAVPESVQENNSSVLKNLGSLQLEFQNCINRYYKSGKIDKARAEEMSAEVDARGLAIWESVIKLSPNDPSGYAGTGGYLLKANRNADADRVIVTGLNTCGPHPELIRLLIIHDDRIGQSQRALDFALIVARKNPDNPNVWRVLIDAAKQANRRDIAIQACVEMRKSKPGLFFPDMAEGILWLETGEPHKALECLNKLDEKYRLNEPGIAQSYVKALVDSGNSILMPEFVSKVYDVADKTNNPLLAISMMQGLSQSTMTADLADLLVNYLDRIMARWPTDPRVAIDGQWMRAEAQYKSAELCAERWEPKRLERAFQSFDSLRKEFENDQRSYVRLAQMQLFGMKKPDLALLNINKLAKLGSPSPEARTIMGAVYNENKQYADSIAAIEPLVKTPSVTGEALTHLAMAHHGQGDSVKAKNLLQRASMQKMNDHERDLYKNAAAVIVKE